MTSQRAWRHRIWGALAATMRSGAYEDLLPDLTKKQLDEMDDAEHDRLEKAWNAVEHQLDRLAGPA